MHPMKSLHLMFLTLLAGALAAPAAKPQDVALADAYRVRGTLF